MAKADIQGRVNYLISKYGGLRGAERATGISRGTLTRVARGNYEPTKANRNKINRQFRQKAPTGVKNREKRGRRAGYARVDEETARKLEASYRKQGKTVTVHAEQGGIINVIGVDQQRTAYGRGSSVDSAKNAMLINQEALATQPSTAPTYNPRGRATYRVIPMEGTV